MDDFEHSLRVKQALHLLRLMQERKFPLISEKDLYLSSLSREPFPEDPGEKSDPPGESQQTDPVFPEGFPMSGSLLVISRSEVEADFEWRLSESEVETLASGYDLLSPPLSFAGWGLWLLFAADNPEDSGYPLALSLCKYLERWSPSPLVRYWLGSVKADGGRREEEEIGRGRWQRYSPNLCNVYNHHWLTISELRTRVGCCSEPPPAGTLSVIIRLRTGPEADDDMKSLSEREEPTSSRQVAAEKIRQTDIEDDEMKSLSEREEPTSSREVAAEKFAKTAIEDGEMWTVVEYEEPTSSLEGIAEKGTQTGEDDEMKSLVEREEPASSLAGTAEKGTQSDVEAFQRNVFETLEQLSDEVKKIKILLQSSTKEPVPNDIQTGCPSFPITTEEDLKEFEEYLKIKEQFYSVCTYLSTTGGLSVKDCTKRILQKVISNNLSLSYNWKGIRGSKKAFSSLECVNALILGAVRMHKNFQDATDFEIQSTVKQWLMHAKDRAGKKIPS